jgi:RNA polymerase sigma-70 factor (ECF subfamily)
MTVLEFNSRLTMYKDALKRFAYSLTNNTDDALDLVQETYLKALKYRNKYREEVNFKAWVMTIMKNTFINVYRRRQKANTFLDNTPNSYYVAGASKPSDASPESIMSEQEILKLIDNLDEAYSIPFKRHVDGFKYQEIAEELELPIGTVKSRIFYARKILAEQING